MAFAKRILVATDFSPHARAAYGPAQELARAFGAEILLVHVHDASVPTPSAEGLRLASEEEADAALEARLQKLAHVELADAVVHTSVVVDDDVPGAICRYATEHRADLIVIATQGVTGLKRLLLGSVAEAVVRGARCPVLTIRAEG